MGIGAAESFASADEVATAKYQQDEAELTGMPLPPVPDKPQDIPKTAENGLICPLCHKGVIDQRVEDIAGAWVCPTSKNGKPLPAFKCVDNDDFKNPTCKFASWKLTEGDAGLIPAAPEKEETAKSVPLAIQ